MEAQKSQTPSLDYIYHTQMKAATTNCLLLPLAFQLIISFMELLDLAWGLGGVHNLTKCSLIIDVPTP
jgi:hypothetical protein